MMLTAVEPGYRHYVVADGVVTRYAAGSFIDIASPDGGSRRYALTPGTRVDAARLRSHEATLRPGRRVNLTARLDGDAATATTIRVS